MFGGHEHRLQRASARPNDDANIQLFRPTTDTYIVRNSASPMTVTLPTNPSTANLMTGKEYKVKNINTRTCGASGQREYRQSKHVSAEPVASS